MAGLRRLLKTGTEPVAGTGRVDFTGCKAGDDLYIVATAEDSNTNIPTFGSTPAGWSKLDDQAGTTRARFALFYKSAAGSETTVDITATGTGTIHVAASGIAVALGTPDHGSIGSASCGTGSGGTVFAAPDAVTDNDGDHVLTFVGARANAQIGTTGSIGRRSVSTFIGSTTTSAIFWRETLAAGTQDLEGVWGNTTNESWAFVVKYAQDTAYHEVTDDFNYTEDPLSNGGIWKTSSFTPFSTSEVMETNGSTAQGDGASDFHMAVHEFFYERDSEIEVEVDTKGVNGTDQLRMYLRMTDFSGGATMEAYELRYEPLSGTDTLKLFRIVNGTGTQIGTTQNQEIANGDVLKFRAIGQQLYVYLNGTEIYHWTDTGGAVLRGQVGFQVFGNTFRIDNFAARKVTPEVATYVCPVTSGGSATAASTTNVTLPIALPGDIYLLHFTTFKTVAGDINISVPGFTVFGSYTQGDRKYFILTRQCDGSEGDVESATIVRVATATGTNPSSTRWRVAEITFVGNPDDIFNINPFNENEEASSTSWTTDAVSGTDGDLLVVGVHHDSTSNITSTNSETDVVETQDAASNSAGTSMALYIKALRTSTTEQLTGTLSSAAAHRSFIYSLNAPAPPPTEDSGTVTLTFTPSFAETYGTVDADTVYLDLQPSGVDEYTGVQIYEDSGTIPLLFTITGVDAFQAVDAATVGLLLTPGGTETLEQTVEDVGTIYLDFTPSGTDYIHVCKPRFRGTLLTWTYDPDAMRADWYGGLLNPEWRGELLQVELAVNYAC